MASNYWALVPSIHYTQTHQQDGLTPSDISYPSQAVFICTPTNLADLHQQSSP